MNIESLNEQGSLMEDLDIIGQHWSCKAFVDRVKLALSNGEKGGQYKEAFEEAYSAVQMDQQNTLDMGVIDRVTGGGKSVVNSWPLAVAREIDIAASGLPFTVEYPLNQALGDDSKKEPLRYVASIILRMATLKRFENKTMDPSCHEDLVRSFGGVLPQTIASELGGAVLAAAELEPEKNISR